MKTLPTLLALSLLLTACGTSINVADDETVDAYPELKPVMLAWQGLVEAATEKDCTATLEYFRLTLKVDEEACPDIFAYFEEEVPEIDWARTDWSATGGKAKIYELDGGSVASFIHNEADDSWRSDEKFWE